MATAEEYQLAEARNLAALDTTDLARELYALHSETPAVAWEDTTGPTKRRWILTADAAQRDARAVLGAEQARLASLARSQAKGDAVDAYRAAITTTIPAHRIETRINGFKDGWDAAMVHLTMIEGAK